MKLSAGGFGDAFFSRECVLGSALVFAAVLFTGCREKRPSLLHGSPKLSVARLLDAGATDAGTDQEKPGPVDTLEWTFPNGGRAVVLVPRTTRRLPLVIALHGRGEAVKGAALGAWGWPRDYKLTTAIERYADPPLTAADFQTFVTDERLRIFNHSLTTKPYGGLIVACAYVPDLNVQSTAELDGYADYLVHTLLPRLRAETPVRPDDIGIDGVSLGGAVAFYVGFKYPEEFARVGAIQAAISESEAPTWMERIVRARSLRPSLSIRLITSADDYFRDGNHRLSVMMTAADISHRYLDLPGPHDYIFNQGPGAYELLFFHERGGRTGEPE